MAQLWFPLVSPYHALVINPSSPFRSFLAVSLFVGVTVLGVALDLWTKNLAFEKLSHGVTFDVTPAYPNGHFNANPTEPYEFIPGWLHFVVTANEGAVFGLGRGQRPLFVVVSIVAIVVLTSLFAKSDSRWFYQLLLGMLLAGVLGNMYDRVRFGYVRDMILIFPEWKNPLRGLFPGWQELFPWIFNVADSFLCVGVFLMIVYSFFQKPDPEVETGASSTGRSSASRTDVREGRIIAEMRPTPPDARSSSRSD